MNKTFLRGDKIALALILSVVIISFASAIPGVPHQFYGSVEGSNGVSAPDGLLITAKIDGTEVAATTTSGGSYGLNDNIFYVQDPNGDRVGKTIEFFVESEKVAEYTFQNGKSTELNLITSVAYSSGNTGSGSSSSGSSSSSGGGGGSSGGGGGGGSIVTTTSTQENDTNSTLISSNNCEENWTCSEWLDCVNTVQKRVCTDKNNCGTEEDKPIVQRECLQEDLQPSVGTRITGAAIAVKDLASENKWIGIVILLVLVVIGVMVYRKFYSKKGVSEETETESKEEIKKDSE